MKTKWIAFLMLGVMLCSLGGCKKVALQKEQEDCGGTGYGVTEKTVLTLQDLYFLRPGTKRDNINEKLGSPLSYALEENNNDTYRLTDGETLLLTYNENDKVVTAMLTDTAGKKQDFFSYLNDMGIISNYVSSGGTTTEKQPEKEESQTNSPATQEKPTATPDNESQESDNSFFSAKRYSYEMAKQILKLDEERETIVSALGKPNAFSSVTFAKDSYLIDVYNMEDGGLLYLDYGYNRTNLRAVRQVKGTVITSWLGTWGQEAKPEGYIRLTRNQSVFNTLKKNAKPSEIYRRFGAPDWLEGNVSRYRDAYMLDGGDIFYLDFGPNHAGLAAVVLMKEDGSVVNYTLK